MHHNTRKSLQEHSCLAFNLHRVQQKCLQCSFEGVT